eukprot:165011-Pyramimonas_sp.AAC.1
MPRGWADYCRAGAERRRVRPPSSSPTAQVRMRSTVAGGRHLRGRGWRGAVHDESPIGRCWHGGACRAVPPHPRGSSLVGGAADTWN